MDASAETLYFTDVSNHCLRSVDLATGVIATIAGRRPPRDGGQSPPGTADPRPRLLSPPTRCGSPSTPSAISTSPTPTRTGCAASTRQPAISPRSPATVRKAFAGDGGPATAASLAVPHGCRFDRDGNAFIADTHNHRIRRVDAATGVITTVAGTGEKGYSGDGLPALESKLYGPLAVDAAANGDLYIVDTDNLRFRCLEAGHRHPAHRRRLRPDGADRHRHPRPRSEVRTPPGHPRARRPGSTSSTATTRASSASTLASGMLYRAAGDRKQRLLRRRRSGGRGAARPLLQHGDRSCGEHLRQGQRQRENPPRRRGERPDLHGGRPRRARLLRRRRPRPSRRR